MKLLPVIFAGTHLVACQPPPGVIDTASLVNKMSTQMNAQFAEYVATENQVRSDDAKRLAFMRVRSERLAATNQDQFDILRLAKDDDANRILQGIKAGRIDDANIGPNAPTVRYSKTLATEFGKNSFDAAPLKNVSTVAGAIAKPRSLEEQLRVLGAFGQEVYVDMKKANESKNGK